MKTPSITRLATLNLLCTLMLSAAAAPPAGGTGQTGPVSAAAGRSESDIVALLDARAVQVEAQGAGIDEVRVRVRRRSPQDVRVCVPVGTFFVCENASAQNMVATEERAVLLTADDWANLSVPAACANRPKDIPESGDGFRVTRSPQQADLRALMPVLAAAKAPYAVRQAAVWIVTDDADFDDLGSLLETENPLGIGGHRVIGEPEAAKAMRMCWDAGIDLHGRAIWRDRERIARAVDDPQVRSWLHGLATPQGRERVRGNEASALQVPAASRSASSPEWKLTLESVAAARIEPAQDKYSHPLVGVVLRIEAARTSAVVDLIKELPQATRRDGSVLGPFLTFDAAASGGQHPGIAFNGTSTATSWEVFVAGAAYGRREGSTFFASPMLVQKNGSNLSYELSRGEFATIGFVFDCPIFEIRSLSFLGLVIEIARPGR